MARPAIRASANKTMKMKNKTLAIPAAAAEIPVKPNNAAIIETIKNISAHRNIEFLLLKKVEFKWLYGEIDFKFDLLSKRGVEPFLYHFVF